MKSSARAQRGQTQRGWTLSIAGLSLMLWLTACGSQPAQEQSEAPAEPTPSAEAAPQRHDLHGKVVSVDKATKSVVVDHDEIPDFMGAMAMPYVVKDESLLDTLAPGNEVNAEVVVDPSGSMWLENIVVAGGATQ